MRNFLEDMALAVLEQRDGNGVDGKEARTAIWTTIPATLYSLE